MKPDSSVIPFGKYKGQPVEILQQDPGYVEWLLGQGWVKERFQSLHTLIINNFQEPSETPAHNRLQIRFLDDEFRARCSHAALQALRLEWLRAHPYRVPLAPPDFELGGIDVSWRVDCWACSETVQKNTTHTELYELYHQEQHALGYGPLAVGTPLQDKMTRFQANPQARFGLFDNDPLPTAAQLHEERVRYARYQTERACYEKATRALDKAFEPYRPFFEMHLTATTYAWDIALGHEQRFVCECKPSVGDDYPAILRAMRASVKGENRLLVLDTCTAIGATFEQIRTVFRLAGILVLTVDEIEQTPPLPTHHWSDLPNPLEPGN